MEITGTEDDTTIVEEMCSDENVFQLTTDTKYIEMKYPEISNKYSEFETVNNLILDKVKEFNTYYDEQITDEKIWNFYGRYKVTELAKDVVSILLYVTK